MICSIPGVTLDNMPVKAGGWRLNGNTFNIIKCLNPLACVGNKGILKTLIPATNADANATNATVNRRQLSSQPIIPTYESEITAADALCAEGHTGFLCGACAADNHGYSDSTPCVACEGSIVAGFIPLILLLLAAVAALIINKKYGSLGISVESVMKDGVESTVKAKMKSKLDDEIKNAESGKSKSKSGLVLRFLGKLQKGQKKVKNMKKKIKNVVKVVKFFRQFSKGGTKLKILLSLWQVLQGIGSAFSIPFPPFYESAVSSVGGLIQIELPSIMPLDCIIRTSFYSRVAFKCIWPLVAYAVIGWRARVQYKRGNDGAADSMINFAFFIMFLVYPSVSTSVLSMFYCMGPDVGLEDGSSYLRVDLSVRQLVSIPRPLGCRLDLRASHASLANPDVAVSILRPVA